MVLCEYFLCSDGYRWCYVHTVSCACYVYGTMYIWCCVNEFTSDVVSMWCRVHVLHMVLCACGVVCMSCM